MAIGAADSGKHSSKNILQFLVSKLEGEFFGNQEKQVEILRGFITSLTNHKRDVKPEEIDQVYTSLTNSLGRIPGIIEFVEGLEQAGFVTESQSIQAITGMPELSDAVKMEFGENVELSFRKELSSVTVEPESLMNVISTAFDADGAWFIQEGYISFIETYRVIPGFYAKKGDSTIVEIIVSDFSNEGLRDIVNYLSKKFSSVQLAVSPREEFDACLEKIRRPAESIIGDAYAEIG